MAQSSRSTAYPSMPPALAASHHLHSLSDANRYANRFLCNVNPYIRFAQYSLLPPQAVIKPRIIYDYELLYIKSGTADITIGDKCYHAAQGDFFFFKPGCEHSLLVHDDYLVQPHIHFDLTYQDANSPEIPISFMTYDQMTPEQRRLIRPDESRQFFENFPDHMRFSNPQYIEQLLFDVIFSYSSPELFNELRLKWQFMRMLDQLLNEISWQQVTRTNYMAERAQRIKLYLERHLDRRISLEELADVYHLDRSYISRCFHKIYNDSPIHYHLLLRLNRAKSMVLYTNLSLTDIAEQNGFSSLQDFSRVFHRIEGVSPSALRQE